MLAGGAGFRCERWAGGCLAVVAQLRSVLGGLTVAECLFLDVVACFCSDGRERCGGRIRHVSDRIAGQPPRGDHSAAVARVQ